MSGPAHEPLSASGPLCQNRRVSGAPTDTDPRRARRWRRAALAAFLGAPALLCVLTFVLAGPDLASLLAPWLGPFAGMVWGHADCTMWNQSRGAAIAAIALGLGSLALFVVADRRKGPLAALIPGALWSLVWCALATISALNAHL